MSDVGSEGSRGGGGDEGEPPSPQPQPQQQHKVRRIRKARHLLRKFGKLNRTRTSPPPPPLYEDDLGKGCYLCFLPPRAPPRPALGPNTGDPSGSKPPTYYDFLKSLIEKNDFYSPECNVHRDIP